MNIQAEKLEIMKRILETENPEILHSIKKRLKKERKVDFWEALPKDQQDEILKGIEEVEKGETVDYEDLIRKHRTSFPARG
ncbi:MAG: hypothetical protein H7X84_00250 [Verrucomicrobia bacterium]|nr:hypothetical protein [Prolixibacteraceae bacterium]